MNTKSKILTNTFKPIINQRNANAYQRRPKHVKRIAKVCNKMQILARFSSPGALRVAFAVDVYALRAPFEILKNI